MLARRLLIVSTSAALHLGSAALALLLTGVGDTSPILIDLVSDAQTIERERSDSAPAPPAPVVTARRPRAAHPSVGAQSDAPASIAPMRAPVTREEGPPLAPPVAEPDRAPQAEPAPHAEATAPGRGSDEAAPALVTPNILPTIAESFSKISGSGEPDNAAGKVAGAGGDGAAEKRSGGSGSRSGLTPGSSSDPGPGTAGGSPGGGAGSSLAAAREGRDGIPAEYGPYLRGFRRRVEESLDYPLSARRRGLSGTVEIEVLLEASGRVSAVRLISSSTHAVLDEAALRTVRGLTAEPFPAPLPRRPLRIRLPLTFELR